MFHLIISLDYELPVSGDADVTRHMIEPTRRALRICAERGAPLTIMAEMAELWAHERAARGGAREHDRAARAMRSQLAAAVEQGHDVQLHLHPQWVHARWERQRWLLDYTHYRLTDFSDEEMVALLRRGREDLEALLCPRAEDYACIGFRAGHWTTAPTPRFLAALRAAGIRSDSSVFKWGLAWGPAACFDYRDAASNVAAWYADPGDLNREHPDGEILEVPIATDRVPLWRLLTARRLWRALHYRRENHRIIAAVRATGRSPDPKPAAAARHGLLGRLGRLWPRKLDYGKLSAREMLAMVRGLLREHPPAGDGFPLPIMMIGHAKQRGAERGLDQFLRLARAEFGDALVPATYRGYYAAYAHAAQGAAHRSSGER